MTGRAAISFRERVATVVDTRFRGNVSEAARDCGIEMTTLWRFLNEPTRVVSLRTFACLCTWAGINPAEVINEFTG